MFPSGRQYSLAKQMNDSCAFFLVVPLPKKSELFQSSCGKAFHNIWTGHQQSDYFIIKMIIANLVHFLLTQHFHCNLMIIPRQFRL
ncbi:hypothetical protein CLV42_116101 [Chitinophaga ginsengisoli]|uniref:Uncharacterized protein n=1 Tax=Chitinophaga ginsengisoli TaxID=363837 RepID=A0A2P8FR35_9BACT|nr:hypothetical protein CLV42_116101 [Chitinophaga ginsengisoli]